MQSREDGVAKATCELFDRGAIRERVCACVV